MKNLSASGMSRCLSFAANRALFEHVSFELGFKSKADSSFVRSQLLVDIAEINEGRVVFCFPSTLPGVFSVKDVWFHDDGMLGSAALMGCVNDPYVELPRDDSRLSKGPNQTDTDNPSTVRNINNETPNDNVSANRSNANGKHEYWVTIFDLESGTAFADIIYALISGCLRITIKAKDLETGSYRLFTNEIMPTLCHYKCQRQLGSNDLRGTA
jgi:hypothetical protein